MNILPISNSTDTIDIQSLDAETVESIREIIRLEGVLHWNREGEVRVVSFPVLMDVFENYDYWTVLSEKQQFDMPKDIGNIYWGDTQTLLKMPTEL